MREPDEIVMSLDHYNHLVDQISILNRMIELLRLELYRDKKDPGKNLGLIKD